MDDMNLLAAWLGVACGVLAGAVQGLFFHRDDWLGGYNSWPRRMTRLGHISFFGLAGVNLAFALSARHLGFASPPWWPSLLLVVGAIAMPTICYFSAFVKPFRHLFFIPVTAVFAGSAWFIYEGILR